MFGYGAAYRVLRCEHRIAYIAGTIFSAGSSFTEENSVHRKSNVRIVLFD